MSQFLIKSSCLVFQIKILLTGVIWTWYTLRLIDVKDLLKLKVHVQVLHVRFISAIM